MALQHLGGANAASPTTTFSLYLPKQERGYWGGKKQVDISKQDWQMKQTRECNGELGPQNERLVSHGQARTRSAGVPCIRRRWPHGGEDAKPYIYSSSVEEWECAPCTPSRAEPWEIRQAGSTDCQVGSPQTHGRIAYGGGLKVKSNKRNNHQMTENEPGGLCQIMAGFKRNEFFLPED